MLSIKKTEIQMEEDRRRKSTEQVEVLQEELELEKEKKELISSLFDDWIYEYNIRDHTFTTISGNGAPYCFKEVAKGETSFPMLSGIKM